MGNKTGVKVLHDNIDGDTCKICGRKTEYKNIICEDHISFAEEHKLTYVLEVDMPESTDKLEDSHFTGKSVTVNQFIIDGLLRGSDEDVGILYCFDKEDFAQLINMAKAVKEKFKKSLH